MKISTTLGIIPLLILFVSGISNTFAQRPYQIKGQVDNLLNGTVLSLLKNEGNLLVTVATDTVANGAFDFRGTIDELCQFGLSATTKGFPNQWLEIWLKPGVNISITGKDKLLKTWKISSPVPEQKEVQAFIEKSKHQWAQIQSLSIQENALFDQRETASTEQRKAMKKQVDSLRLIQDSLRLIVQRNDIILLGQKKKQGTIWMNKLKELSRSSKYSKNKNFQQAVLQQYRNLPPVVRNSSPGIEIHQILFPPKRVQLNEKIADTTFTGLDGSKHSLGDYSGKYLLIDFWSIGCGPCIAAMPELKKINQDYRDQITVISISLDEKLTTWKKGSEHTKITWPNLSDLKGMTGFAAKYGVSGIPHYLIVSPEGILLDSWVGYSEGGLIKKVVHFIKK